jgi:hypothetical protein
MNYRCLMYSKELNMYFIDDFCSLQHAKDNFNTKYTHDVSVQAASFYGILHFS